MPDNSTVLPLFTVLSRIVRAAVFTPPAGGVKMMPTTQLCPALRVLPVVSRQLVVFGSMEKSPLFAPVIIALSISSSELPVFAILASVAALDVPFNCPGKTRSPFGPTLRTACAVGDVVPLMM